MRINWLQMLLRGAQVLVLCAVIAAINARDIRYLFQLVVTVCIGIPCWLMFEFGRLLVPRKYCHCSVEDGDHGWPKGWRALALAAASIGVGFSAGVPLALWLWPFPGDGIPPLSGLMNALLTAVVAGAMGSFFFGARSARAMLQAEASTAERTAAEARLMLLQSQLEPHMLFNTLANLHALIGTDPTAARRMLDWLNGFLRASLNASRTTAHPLEAEFERLRDYLALMSIRMGQRLTHALHLPDELRAQPVPPLLLQPLVENAIRHGLEPCVKGGHIEVSAARADQQLMLTVRDSGVGFNPGTRPPAAEGHFGLAQVIERVASTYGGQGQVQVQSQPGNGTTIRIALPCPSPIPP